MVNICTKFEVSSFIRYENVSEDMMLLKSIFQLQLFQA